MSNFLKGNYQLAEKSEKPDVLESSEDPQSRLQREFERRAMEKLGGSIAFVMKSSDFVWQPSESKNPRLRGDNSKTGSDNRNA